MKKENIYLSTIATDAAKTAKEYGFGLEIAEYCTAVDSYMIIFSPYFTFVFSSRANLLSNEVIREAILFCISFEGNSTTSDAISEI